MSKVSPDSTKVSTKHKCESLVVTCIDFRFQTVMDEWEKLKLGEDTFDRVGLAGSCLDVYSVLKNLEVSVSLHKIKQVVLINHEDCGAYGKDGSFEQHKADLRSARKMIGELYPQLHVNLYYVKLNGQFVRVG